MTDYLEHIYHGVKQINYLYVMICMVGVCSSYQGHQFAVMNVMKLLLYYNSCLSCHFNLDLLIDK